ncbi:MAG: hypothetical protein ACFFCQ_14370, partial [Promethearchaeota archaeon]
MSKKQTGIFIKFGIFIILMMVISITGIILSVEHNITDQSTVLPTVGKNVGRASKLILTPDTDNVNFEEEVFFEIWRDGTLKSLWKFEDDGNDLLSFPINLPTPLNSSYPGIRDMQIDFMISEVPQLAPEWGFMANYDQFGGGFYPDYASFSSNELLIRLRVWNATNSLDDTRIFIEDIMDVLSVDFGMNFHLMSNTTATDSYGRYYLEQSWRAFLFDLDNIWPDLFSTLPLEEGLATTTNSKLMQANTKSLYIIAEWDEVPNRANSSAIEDQDERWEFETTFSIIEKQKFVLNSDSNKIYLKDLLNFDEVLRSHSKANDSEIYVRIPYGSMIDTVEPESDSNDVCHVGWDLFLHDNRIMNLDYIEFTLDTLPMPSLFVHATANSTVVSPGDIVQIDYDITNIGESPAYNIQFWGFDNTTPNVAGEEWTFINATHPDSPYTLLDNGQAYLEIDQINP